MLARRRLTAALVLTVIIVGFSPGPSPATAADDQRETLIKVMAPFAPDGTLNPALTVRERQSVPACAGGSVATERSDAWRCVTFDPCFAPPPWAADRSALACPDPWSGEVLLVTVQTPLPTPEECRARTTPPEPRCPGPLDFTSDPWALELANGARCLKKVQGTLIGLTTDITSGYLCSGPVGLAGWTDRPFVDKSRPLWRVLFLGAGDYAIEEVAVLVAWY